MKLSPLMCLLALAWAGCTTFGEVRSAEVVPGPSFEVRATLATPPGDVAGWFWSFDCAEGCSHSIIGTELEYSYGHVPAGGGTPNELGLGLVGVFPFAHGYVQLGRGRRPYGIGARVGVPLSGWSEHQVFGRMDIPLGSDARLVLDPSVFLHRARTGNGQSYGHVLGLLGAIGLDATDGGTTLLPALTVGALEVERTRYGERDGPFWHPIAIVSVGLRWHHGRK